jgi:hypothetical protein
VFLCLNDSASEHDYKKCTQRFVKSLRKSGLINGHTEERLEKCARNLYPDDEDHDDDDD